MWQSKDLEGITEETFSRKHFSKNLKRYVDMWRKRIPDQEIKCKRLAMGCCTQEAEEAHVTETVSKER